MVVDKRFSTWLFSEYYESRRLDFCAFYQAIRAGMGAIVK